jgi:hypothetical protein
LSPWPGSLLKVSEFQFCARHFKKELKANMRNPLLKFATVMFVNAVAVAQMLPNAGAANVTVNAAGRLSTVGATAYGVHTSVYDNQNGNASLPSLLIQSGVTALRYPGGGYADVFHWSVSRSALSGGGLSPWFGNTNSFGYVASGTDFGSFAKLLTNAQCQAIITINFGSGLKWSSPAHTGLTIPPTNAEPPEAAAWVAYANANTNIFGTTNDVTLGTDSIGNNWKTAGFWAMLRAATPLGTDDGYNFLRINRKAPIGIKFWEIGNETFGTGYYSTNTDGYSVNYAVPYPNTTFTRYGNPILSPATYGMGVKSFSLLMKAVDPTIKIGAVVSTPPGDYSWDSFGGQHWTPQVLAQCATNIDFVIAHWYPYAGSSDNGSSLLPQVPSTLPPMVNGTAPHTDTSSGLRDWINDYRADGTNVQIFITEFNYMGTEVDSFNGEPTYGPVNAMFAADSYASWLELGVSNVDWLEMNKTTFLGDSNPLVRGAAYYAVQLTHDIAGVGDQLVSATSDNSSLRVHAAVQQNGRLGVMLLNETMTSSLTVNITVTNKNLAGPATQIQFGTNNFPGGSETPGSPPATNTVSVTGNTLSVVVPAYTITVLEIPILSNSPPVISAISNYTVNAGQTVAFTASATETNQPGLSLNFSLLNAPTNAAFVPHIGAFNTVAFSWRPLVSQAGTTNTMTLQVSDTNVPPLTASQNFTVTVNPLTTPSVTSAVLSNGRIGFQIGGAAGPDYAVQSSTDLVVWNTQFITNSPAPPFNWVDTNHAVLPREFYRVKIGPPLP